MVSCVAVHFGLGFFCRNGKEIKVIELIKYKGSLNIKGGGGESGFVSA